MAVIRPFRAWRYTETEGENINQRFSPLFDVVSPEQLEKLYENPLNSIHLSVPRSHEAVIGCLEEWKARGVIQQDSIPGIYIYYQHFSLFGESEKLVRKGFVSLIRTDSDSGKAGSGIVLHEDTIAASVEDRTRLLEKTLMNTAPTHGLYSDPEFSLEDLMDSYMESPMYEYVDYQGVVNQLAVVHDRRDIEQFQSLLQTQKVYLADGHHRLASSVYLQKKSLQQPATFSKDSFRNYHLMYLTNLCSDDLRILPIHRLLDLGSATHNPNPIVARLQVFFEVEDITFSRVPTYELVKGKSACFGMVLGSLHFLLTLKPEINPLEDIEIDLPDAVKQLDYTLLHYFIFDKVFGIPYHEQNRSDAISYIKDYGQAVKKAVHRRELIAFITPETSMEQMMQVCKSNALMPQKSTYFYPKVVCGLVFASVDDHENKSPFDISFGFSEAATTAT